MLRSYSELILIESHRDRFLYLSNRPDHIGETFAQARWVNQEFYRSREWKQTRRAVILRDKGNDMGVEGHPVYGHPRVHHMNSINLRDFEKHSYDRLLNPEFLITVSHDTHNAIHYGTELSLKIPLVERQRGDTIFW